MTTIMQETQKNKWEIFNNRFADAYFLADKKTIVCKATTNYIPEKEFKELFGAIGEFIKTHRVEKLIFDKSKLTVFHQPSMVWYHIVWKAEMAIYGLLTYRKILPNDSFFRQSVKIGREKIKKEHPDFNFDKFDIQYCDSLEEALEK
ncbi:MAG: hypothetical protein NZ551_00810 [Microscillaceae bacterium]|nr:hypothetical protein [Microscillaceae bacterium]MDW8459729.1 hypothetical protein [Cytophagales bacterium]